MLLADRFAKRLPSATLDFVRNAHAQPSRRIPVALAEQGEALRALPEGPS